MTDSPEDLLAKMATDMGMPDSMAFLLKSLAGIRSGKHSLGVISQHGKNDPTFSAVPSHLASCFTYDRDAINTQQEIEDLVREAVTNERTFGVNELLAATMAMLDLLTKFADIAQQIEDEQNDMPDGHSRN